MTKLELQFKNKIMRRIYAAWFLKKLFSPSFLRTVFTVAMLTKLFHEVSVVNVINNVPSESFYSSYNYFAFAFSHTELSVQLYLLSVFIIAIWFALDNLMGKIAFLKTGGSN